MDRNNINAPMGEISLVPSLHKECSDLMKKSFKLIKTEVNRHYVGFLEIKQNKNNESNV